MGLDVSVYKNVKLTESEYDYDFIAKVIDEAWNYKIKNLKNWGKYEGERCNIDIGYSYNTHNRFREHLIKLINRHDLLEQNGNIDWYKLEKETELPFYDFIDFADNEGCLDWEINVKIYNDFKKWHKKAMKYFKSEFYYDEYYNLWLEIFKQGKENNSVIVFH